MLCIFNPLSLIQNLSCFFSYFLNSLQLAYNIFVIEKNGKEKTGHFGISEIDLNELENCKQM